MAEWFKEHQENYYFGYNCETKVWHAEFQQDLVNNFIPVKFAGTQCICCKEEISFKK